MRTFAILIFILASYFIFSQENTKKDLIKLITVKEDSLGYELKTGRLLFLDDYFGDWTYSAVLNGQEVKAYVTGEFSEVISRPGVKKGTTISVQKLIKYNSGGSAQYIGPIKIRIE